MTNKEIKMIFDIPEKELIFLVLRKINFKKKERKIIDLYYIKGFTEEETAEELNLSVNAIQKIKKKIINKLTTVWENNTIVSMILNREKNKGIH